MGWMGQSPGLRSRPIAAHFSTSRLISCSTLRFLWPSLSDPARNALAAATLIASFLANGGAFLAYAIAAAKRGLATSAQGEKSMYYVAGLAEGGETIAVFCALCLWPDAFAWIAYFFATLCMLSAIGRLLVGWRTLT